MESPSDSNECCSSSPNGSGKWSRSMKRKAEQDEELAGHRVDAVDDSDCFSVARIEIENECMVLRETVNSQQQQIQELCMELDEERNASSTAANEAMSLILRLQNEKAEVQMEAVQFKRFAEEKMAHDEQELLCLEDLLHKKNQLIESLNSEIQAYRNRLMSYDSDQFDFGDAKEGSFTSGQNGNRRDREKQENADFHEPEESNRSVYSEDTPVRGLKFNSFAYPPLKCSLSGTEDFSDDDDPLDFVNYVSGVPHRDRGQVENFADSKGLNTPKGSKHSRHLSADSTSACSVVVKEGNQECVAENTENEEYVAENMFTSGPSENPKRLKEFSTLEDYCCSTNWGNSADDAADDASDVIDAVDSTHGAGDSRKKSDENEGSEAEQSPYDSKVESPTYYTTDANFFNLRQDDGPFDCKVQHGKPDKKSGIPRDSLKRTNMGGRDIAKKLYSSLQSLEADMESMREIIMSMQADDCI
ncbi:myosin-binding protein 7-like [Nymphaea colorata]|uniref:myosin-binding protein 7-like n=1 Tax=Nymphaea colorata TaxID=210225 RepID=UPI00129E7B99|nr:myosin-binding protein 7-like [Nymphaea colorata]